MKNILARLNLYMRQFLLNIYSDADIKTLTTHKKVSIVKRFLLRNVVKKDRLLIPLFGPIAFQMIRSGHSLGIFEFLNKSQSATRQEIATKLNLSTHSVDVILLGLCSLKIIHKINGRYYNDPLFAKVLSNNFADGLFLKWIDFAHHLVFPASNYLLESLKDDSPVGLIKTFNGNQGSFYEEISKDKNKMSYFDELMKCVTNINQNTVASLPIFSKFNHVLDVGGGTGSMAIAIANYHKSIKVTVFDFPGVIDLANKKFNANSLSGRLSGIGGNILEEPMPTGFDCITLCHFIGLFSEKANIANIKSAYNALKSNDYLCIFTPIINNNEDGPISTGVFSSYFLFLANGHGRFYSPLQIRGWMKSVGFNRIQTTLLPGSEAVFIGQKN